MSDNIDRITLAGVRLTGHADFLQFWGELEFTAKFLEIWKIVDPDSDAEPLEAPAFPPTIDELIAKLDRTREAQYALDKHAYHELNENNTRSRSQVQRSQSPNDTPEPSIARSNTVRPDQLITEPVAPIPATYADVKEEEYRYSKNFTLLDGRWNQQKVALTRLYNWVKAAVDPAIMSPAMIKARNDGDTSLKAILRTIKHQLEPSKESITALARSTYNTVLLKANNRRVDPLKWYAEWHAAFLDAEMYKIPEIEGSSGVMDFLNAVSRNMATEWATSEMRTIIANRSRGKPTDTLREYAEIFHSLAVEDKSRSGTRDPSIFATLRGISDGDSERPMKRSKDSDKNRASK